MTNWGFETRQIHAGAVPDRRPAHGRADLSDDELRLSRHRARQGLFGLEELGNIYTRIMNPTQAVFESAWRRSKAASPRWRWRVGRRPRPSRYSTWRRTADTSSPPPRSTAARTTCSLHAAQARYRGHVRQQPRRPRRVARGDTAQHQGLLRRDAGQPQGDVLDFEGVSKVAHDNGIPLVVDNTLATPFLANPLAHGADIVVHSATKYIGGHGTSIGGVIVDGGTFDYEGSGRFPSFTEPDPSYHGLIFAQLPPALFPARYVLKARCSICVTSVRDCTAQFVPLHSGLETLSYRMERHVQNAVAVANWLEARDDVSWSPTPVSPRARGTNVKCATCQGRRRDHRFWHQGRPGGWTEVHRGLELFSHLANVGDVRSLAIHPASTTHSQ